MQKFIKILATFLLVISLSIPNAHTYVAAAEQWVEYPSNTTGNVNKAWKVTFSELVDSGSVSNENVYVKRENGTKVDVKVTVNGPTITVTPTNAAYTIGETYIMYLHSSIQSLTEQSLPNTKFQFTVLGVLEIANSVAQEAKIASEAIKTGQPVFANPLAGTKDELSRANTFVADLEKAIAAAKEKVQAAEELIKAARIKGYSITELNVANTAVNTAEKAIADAEKAVTTAKQVIETASITAQLTVAKSNVVSSSSVEVILAATPTYELTKSDADKFRVNMDGTILQVTDVAKSQSDDTRYKLTIASASSRYPLSGKQGALSVNNTKATISNSEFGYDYQAPAIERVEAVDNRHIKVYFSENMDEETVANVGRYNLYKSTATTSNLLSGTGAVAVLSADKKSVTLTLGGTNTLVATDYTLKITGTVKDAAGNNLRLNTAVDFLATSNQLRDTTRPSLTAAAS
ncbi:Ig-like domain-containing protein [Solibacillus sp. FSL K6-1554]|uniref:Ig-like domain-containing protein n=1 Tax=Solibacillus sp. FSL K6-1554 TaxID=2921472 RepID=UPI0030FC812C